jgi:hypothetical protein
MVPVVIGGIFAVAGGVVAIVMSNSKQSAQSKANAAEESITKAGGTSCVPPTPMSLQGLAGACTAYKNDNQDINTDATIGNVAIGVGAGALAITLIYYLAADKGGEPAQSSSSLFKRATLAPEVGRSTGGLSLTTTF